MGFLQDYLEQRSRDAKEDQQSPEDLLKSMSNNMAAVVDLSEKTINISKSDAATFDNYSIKAVDLSELQLKATQAQNTLLSNIEKAIGGLNTSLKSFLEKDDVGGTSKFRFKDSTRANKERAVKAVGGQAGSLGVGDILDNMPDRRSPSKGKGPGGKWSRAGRAAGTGLLAGVGVYSLAKLFGASDETAETAGEVSGVAGAAGQAYHDYKAAKTTVDAAKTATNVAEGATAATEAAAATSKLGNVSKVLGKVAAPLAVAGSAYDIGSSVNEELAKGGTSGEATARGFGRTARQFYSLGGLTDLVGLEDFNQNLEDGIKESTTGIGTAIQDSLSSSGLGDWIGRSMAVVMSPFSEDARSALKADFESSKQEAWDKVEQLQKYSEGFIKDTKDSYKETGKTFEKTSDNLKESTENLSMLDKLKSWLGDKVQQTTEAVGNKTQEMGNKVIESSKGTVFEKPAAALGGAMKSSGESIAMKGGEIGYDLKKGSKSAVDLALGFQGSSTLKGMTEDQTKAYAGNVMKTESGGRLGIENQYGYMGQYQFGAEALADQGLVDKDKLAAAKAQAKASGQSFYKGGHQAFLNDPSNWKIEGGKEAFLKNKQLQDDTFVKYTNKNIEAGYRSGALNENSTPEDIAAYAKMAQLKGVDGANNYVLKGIDSADANGTKVSDYGRGAAQGLASLTKQVEAAKGNKVEATKVAQAPTEITAGKQAVDTTPKPQVVAQREAQTLVAKNAPVETKPVVVANAQDLVPEANIPQGPLADSSSGRASKVPTLDEVPLMVSDMRLALLNIGQV